MSDLCAGQLEPYLCPVEYHTDTWITRPADAVVFLNRGIAAVMPYARGTDPGAIGLVGSEGFVGLEAVMAPEAPPQAAAMLTSATGYVVEAALLREWLEHAPFRQLLMQYAYAWQRQVAEGALAAMRFTTRQRLARLLLMCEDRNGPSLKLSHHKTAWVLGVRRSSVSEQIPFLEETGAIKVYRSHFHILDRNALLACAGGCYHSSRQGQVSEHRI